MKVSTIVNSRISETGFQFGTRKDTDSAREGAFSFCYFLELRSHGNRSRLGKETSVEKRKETASSDVIEKTRITIAFTKILK